MGYIPCMTERLFFNGPEGIEGKERGGRKEV